MERRGETKSIQSALKFFRNYKSKKDRVKKIPDLAVSGFSADPPFFLFGLSPPVMMASVDGPSRKGCVLTRQREHMCVWITRESSPPSNKVDKNGENVKKKGDGGGTTKVTEIGNQRLNVVNLNLKKIVVTKFIHINSGTEVV